MVACILQAPLIHFGKFAGAKSEVWLPTTFWNVQPASKDVCYTLCSHNTTAGLVGTPVPLAEPASLLLETSLAMLQDSHMNFQLAEDVRHNPINWMVAFCTAYIQLEDDLGDGKAQEKHRQRSQPLIKHPDVDGEDACLNNAAHCLIMLV